MVAEIRDLRKMPNASPAKSIEEKNPEASPSSADFMKVIAEKTALMAEMKMAAQNAS